MNQETREFYNKIAESWYNVRHWTIVEEELKKINEIWDGGKLLNIGCAHGPDFLPFDPNKFEFFGVDVSENLLKFAKEYSKKFKKTFYLALADMKLLPFKDSSFDYVISVAAIHHLLNKNQRIHALKEMRRVLKRDAFISVWNRDNPELPNKEIIEREWIHGKEVFKRRYYLYTKEGLEKELIDAGFEIKKLETGRGDKNILAVIRPTKRPS